MWYESGHGDYRIVPVAASRVKVRVRVRVRVRGADRDTGLFALYPRCWVCLAHDTLARLEEVHAVSLGRDKGGRCFRLQMDFTPTLPSRST